MKNPDRRTLLERMTLALLTAGLAAGCGGDRTLDTGQVAQSDVPRVTAPVVAADDAATLASDNQSFAVDLFHAIAGADGNLVFSPASVSIALAMAYAGAANDTAAQIATTLHFTLPPERLHPAFDALDLALTAAPAGAAPNAFKLELANATWGQQGWPFLPAYLDLLAQDYGAGLRTVDFAGAPEPSRAAINAWVADETDQQIPALLPVGSISALTRLVLTDAVYFHGDWLTPFAPSSPTGTFHATAGDVSVAMMSNPELETPLWSGSGWSAVTLPYVGGAASMILIVPDAGTFAAFQAGLTADGLAAILAAESGSGQVVMPRFKFTTAASLSATLAGLGMPDAFDKAAADFSGIDGGRDLFISDVIHQADIAVDEQGTTAAAATAVIIDLKAAVVTGPTLVIDRPFLFFIRHDPTGALLFAGRVTDPTQ